MKTPAHLSEEMLAIWAETKPSVSFKIGPLGLEALCGCIERMRDARGKIKAEGSVVADARGNPIPHPALAIEKAMQSEIRVWIGKYPAD